MLYHAIDTKKVICSNKEYIEYVGEGEKEKDPIPCGYENFLEIDSPEVIIQPFRPDRESVKGRIRFDTSPTPKPV